jgi:ABC-type nitrate/sulfonate/bicarbonate transport system substrate-binding protein
MRDDAMRTNLLARSGRVFRAGILGVAVLTAGSVTSARAAVEQATVALPAPVVLFLAIFVAQDYFWPKEDLDIKIIDIPGVGSMNAVIAGSVEFSLSSGGSITRAAAHGQRLLAIANLNDQSGQFIAIRKDIADAAHFDPQAPFAERAKILKGKTIATGGLGSVADAVIRIALNAAGLDSEKDATIAPMQPPDILAAFARHAIDGFSLGPPFAQQVVHDGSGVIVLNGVAGDPPGFSPMAAALLVTRPQLCVERKSLCEKMGHSMVEATQFVHDHPKESVAVLKKRFTTLDPAVLTLAADAVIKMTGTPPATNDQELVNGDRMNAEAGFLKPGDQIHSYDGLFTNEYLH